MFERSQSNLENYDLEMDELLKINTTQWTHWSGDKDTHQDYHRSEPTPYKDLDELFISYLPQENAHFVDIGCGKGRVLYYIHHFMKLPVTGIELHGGEFELLEENKESYLKEHAPEQSITLLNEAAQQYVFEPHQTVFYMFNPFSMKIFRQVVDNIKQSVEKDPRLVTMILYYPVRNQREYLRNTTEFKLVQTIRLPWHLDRSQRFEIYEWYP